MARPVAYPAHIEPLVRFVEETAPEHIVARTHDKLAAGTPVKDMLLASALAVVRSSDLPPGHHGEENPGDIPGKRLCFHAGAILA